MTEEKCEHEWVPSGFWDGRTSEGKPTGGPMYKCKKCQERAHSLKEIDKKGGTVVQS